MQKLTTPKGRARFPKLVSPDEFKGKKQYKVDLVMPADDAKALEAKLETVLQGFVEEKRMELEEAISNAGNARDQKKAEAALADFEKAPTREILHEDYDKDGNPTGQLFAKFNTNYSFVDRKTGTEIVRHVPFFDAALNKTKPADVGPGSELKVNFTPSPYYLGGHKGVSLKINAVQILRLSSGGFDNADAESLGFAAEAGGYVGGADEPQVEAVTAGDIGDDGNPDF
jgi:hypothetical protein